jgi:hypothetical protein
VAHYQYIAVAVKGLKENDEAGKRISFVLEFANIRK